MIYFLLLLFLTGCMVGPDFKRPRPPLPQAFINSKKKEEPHAAWWLLFKDPMLNELIQKAICCNLDIKVATARVRQARELLTSTAAPLFPNLSLTGSYTRTLLTQDAPAIFVPANPYQSEYLATFDATWELDLFGGTRRSVEAACDTLKSRLWERKDVLVSLLAEVASNYFSLQGTERKIEATKESISLQQDTLFITESRFQAGLATSLDVVRAQSALKSAEALLPDLYREQDAFIYRIAVLLGKYPQALTFLSHRPAHTYPLIADVPAGLPSCLLQRRPDIRVAEYNLAAATASIGVAIANLFPQISLTGAYGQDSASLNHFFLSQSNTWSYGPAFTLPLFNAGSLVANIHLQEAKQQEALLLYQKSILTAFEDVENRLKQTRESRKTALLLQEVTKENKEAVTLALDLYTAGLTDFINVLQTQESWISSKIEMIDSEVNHSIALASLYKALGGGWQTSLP